MLNCHQYNAPIAIMQKQESSLIIKSGNAVKDYSWILFERISIKYKHINSKLGKTIEIQQNCYIANKEIHRTDKAWAMYHFSNYPEKHQNSGN